MDDAPRGGGPERAEIAEAQMLTGQQTKDEAIELIEEAKAQGRMPARPFGHDDALGLSADSGEQGGKIFRAILAIAIHGGQGAVIAAGHGMAEADGDRALMAKIAMEAQDLPCEARARQGVEVGAGLAGAVVHDDEPRLRPAGRCHGHARRQLLERGPIVEDRHDDGGLRIGRLPHGGDHRAGRGRRLPRKPRPASGEARRARSPRDP